MSGPNGSGPLFTPQEIAAVRRPFRAASLLPARAYHDQAIWDFEREQWFFTDWVCVGREEDVAAPGTYQRMDVQGEDVVLVRARDGVLRAFYNVCRHRGTCIVEPASGSAPRFQCPYHAWIYDLDGTLVRARHTDDLADFRLEDFGLTPIRLATWQGFIFLCFSEQTPPLEAYMGDWFEHHAGFERDYASLRRAARLEYDVAANWKIVAENYSECYHCPGVHPLLNQLTPYDQGEDFFPRGPWKGGWMRFADGFQTMSMDGDRHGRPLLPRTTAVDARRIYYYILWPNLIVSVHPDYVLTHQAWPDGPERTRVVCDLYVHANDVGAVSVSDAVEFWDLTNRQDYHVVELQQRGTRSRSWVAGRFSNQEAAVHAFDLMVMDRYAQDGRHTEREANTRVERPPRTRTARAGVTPP